MDKERFSLHARLPVYRRHLQKAQEIVRKALKQCQKPYVAFSGGKDSTVTADIVRRFLPDIPCIWGDDEWYLPETKAYIDRCKKRGINVIQIKNKTKHTDFFTSHEKGGIKHSEWIKKQGYDAVFMGLRAEESNSRRIMLRKYGPVHKAKDGLLHINPIAWWTIDAVWAYIVSNNLDYNKAYDRLSELGIPPKKQRIGPLAVDRVLQFGQISILKRGWPDLFQRFADKYPEVKQYI